MIPRAARMQQSRWRARCEGPPVMLLYNNVAELRRFRGQRQGPAGTLNDANRRGTSGDHVAYQRYDLAAIELDRAHHLLVRQGAGAVLQVEAGDAERLHRRRDLACNALGRADIERADVDFALEVGGRERRPAALGADLVAHALVVGEQVLPRLRVGLATDADPGDKLAGLRFRMDALVRERRPQAALPRDRLFF